MTCRDPARQLRQYLLEEEDVPPASLAALRHEDLIFCHVAAPLLLATAPLSEFQVEQLIDGATTIGKLMASIDIWQIIANPVGPATRDEVPGRHRYGFCSMPRLVEPNIGCWNITYDPGPARASDYGRSRNEVTLRERLSSVITWSADECRPLLLWATFIRTGDQLITAATPSPPRSSGKARPFAGAAARHNGVGAPGKRGESPRAAPPHAYVRRPRPYPSPDGSAALSDSSLVVLMRNREGYASPRCSSVLGLLVS